MTDQIYFRPFREKRKNVLYSFFNKKIQKFRFKDKKQFHKKYFTQFKIQKTLKKEEEKQKIQLAGIEPAISAVSRPHPNH